MNLAMFLTFSPHQFVVPFTVEGFTLNTVKELEGLLRMVQKYKYHI